MITYLRLNNFMCYEGEHEIDFTEGVNVIVGPNDKGKSTILAALSWITFGKPTGDSIESWDSKERDTWAEVEFSDQTIIRRSRVKGINSYTILKNKKKQEFKAIGANVPQEVANILRLSEINFQGQANNLYPLQLTPNELGNAINKSCSLGDIHETVGRLKSGLTKEKNEKERAQKALNEAKEQLEKLAWVPMIGGKLSAAEEQQKEINHLNSKIQFAKQESESITELKNKIEKISKFVKKADELRKAARNEKKALVNKELDLMKVSEILFLINEGEKQKQRAKRIIKIEKKTAEASEIFIQIDEIEKRISNTIENIKNMRAESVNIERSKLSLDHHIDQIKIIRNSLPPVCPLCGERRKK